MIKDMLCDNCNREFKFKQNQIKVDMLNNEVQKFFFKCPYCNSKFIIMYQDSEVRKNLKQMKDIKTKILEKVRFEESVDKLVDEYKSLYSRNLEISESYKRIYGR